MSYPGQPDLLPINGPIAAKAAGLIDRGKINDTLNFVVPGSHCVGTVPFTARVFDPGHPSEPAFSSSPIRVFAHFEHVPTLPIHVLAIDYRGPGGPIPPPDRIDVLVALLSYTGFTIPVSNYRLTAIDVVPRNSDLTTANDCLGPWAMLLLDMWVARAFTTNPPPSAQDQFLALFPSGTPKPTDGTLGCGRQGLAATFVDEPVTIAHELGHALERDHVAGCDAPTNPDPGYPTYDAYPAGSIGEFGIDMFRSVVFNPASSFDFMSYCPRSWISPYTWIALKNIITRYYQFLPPEGGADQPGAPAGRPEPMDAEREHLYLSFRVYRGERVELLPTFHLGGPAPATEPGKEWPLFCELLDEEERVVVSQRCYLRYPYYDPEGYFLQFNEVLPWFPGVRSIAFRLRGEEIHRVEIGEQAPEVRRLDWDRREEDRAQVSWDVNTPAEAPPAHHVLRYSNDGGNSWRVVMPPSTVPGYDLDLTLLPGGEDCRLQLIASANIRTTTTETEPFALPRKPREAFVLAPDLGATFTEGEPVLLMGSGFSPDFGTPDLEEMVWRSDVDGPLGIGYQVFAQTLSKGHHRIILTIPDGLGGEVSTGVDILVTGVGVV